MFFKVIFIPPKNLSFEKKIEWKKIFLFLRTNAHAEQYSAAPAKSSLIMVMMLTCR